MERIKLGVFPSRIARESGLMQSTVSWLENGDSNFYITPLESVVSVLGKKLNLILKDAELYHYSVGL